MMENTALSYLVGHFNLLKLKVFIQLEDDTIFPSYKGSMLHGWLGHVLKEVDEHAFTVCFGEHADQQPKPYIICPSEDHKTHWKKGEIYHFEITLLGDAIKLSGQFITALKLGKKIGLGPKRTCFKLISISTITGNGLKSGIHIQTLKDYLVNRMNITPIKLSEIECAVAIITPIRLKHQGSIFKSHAPPFELLLNSILRRLIQLCRFWVLDREELFNDIYTQRPEIDVSETISHCFFEDWQRFSKKEQMLLSFGGLMGQISYLGEVSRALPLLYIGEQIHIGSKTTFGLGKYQLIVGD